MSIVPHTIIDLMRHGETTSGSCYIGSTDSILSETGWQQMRGASLGYAPWDMIISSPLKRCRLFAEELSAINNIPLTMEESIQEINFGDFEGKTAKQLMQLDPQAIKNFWKDPINNTPPNGEHYRLFKNRVTNAWQKIIIKVINKHVFLVSHAGVIRTIVQTVLEMPESNLFRLDIKHGGITRIELTGNALEAMPRLLFLNSKL
ncbi:Alpha-ribazole-5'-phosphate phosphatase [hydrothermal vent metagenome]|uniref:Alpha-ribazole-5'-phosphate phosphatase n=1 Tax=hydrothermal vent metagenome TaxID=652676 RepID=A0A3B1A6R2_9ZZZZ